MALLAGRDGRPAARSWTPLDDDLGPIDRRRAVAGTIVAGGELRTYVTLTAGERGRSAGTRWTSRAASPAVELTGDPPALTSVPGGRRDLRPRRPDRRPAPDVTVASTDDRLTITGRRRPVTARLRRRPARRGDSACGSCWSRTTPTSPRSSALGLRNESYAVDVARTCAEAEDLLRTTDFDVACLDLGLPDGDGLDLVRRLATDADLRRPRRSHRADRPRRGRRPGRRPRRRRRRLPRQAVRLLRAAGPAAGPGPARRRARPTCGSATSSLDTAAHRAWRAARELELTAREFSLLRYFVHHPGQVLSAEDLLEHVWDANADPFTISVRVILSRLRRKLGDPPLIMTVTGVGYRCEAPA